MKLKIQSSDKFFTSINAKLDLKQTATVALLQS